MKFTAILAAVVAPLAVLAQAPANVKILNPSAAKWWVAGSDAELKWTGGSFAFTAFIMNNDTTTCQCPPATGGLQLVGVDNAYRTGINFKLPPGINPGGGYFVRMVNPANPTEVYATSETFEVKKQGSAYPTDVPDSTATSSSVANPSSTANGNGTAPAASESPKSGAAAVGAPLAAVAVAGALSYILV